MGLHARIWPSERVSPMFLSAIELIIIKKTLRLIQELQHKGNIQKSHFIPIVAYIHYSLCIGFQIMS